MHRAFYSPLALKVPEYRVKLPVFAFDNDKKRYDDGNASLDKADSRARISAWFSEPICVGATMIALIRGSFRSSPALAKPIGPRP